GTYNLLVSASEHGVERLVQLSTDKAVNPTNVMGATKRVTEMLIQMFAKHTDMKCMAVRFGNVLGSHGSVIPLWEQQIRSGGPVTVVDPNITRYFMTIPEAAQLVLQAGALAQSGSIYVLNMGTPVRMMDLAEKLIRFYGYRPGTDMQIRITGLRPGEKMYEELMMDSERRQMTATSHDRIMIAPPIDMDLDAFGRELDELRASLDTGDDAIIESLVKITGTYVPNRKKAAI
ncbi:MAG: polysaccharide biosynthesis protein, partial [Clostridia bacterium]|nr:polysaccharide biosynthesis protein [Clostridia bacterium]